MMVVTSHRLELASLMMCYKPWLWRRETDGRAAWRSWGGMGTLAPRRALVGIVLHSGLPNSWAPCSWAGGGIHYVEWYPQNFPSPSRVKCLWGSGRARSLGETGWFMPRLRGPAAAQLQPLVSHGNTWAQHDEIIYFSSRRDVWIFIWNSLHFNAGNRWNYKNTPWAKQKQIWHSHWTCR